MKTLTTTLLIIFFLLSLITFAQANITEKIIAVINKGIAINNIENSGISFIMRTDKNACFQKEFYGGNLEIEPKSIKLCYAFELN